MLSIIVSSYQKKYFDNFSLNVKETIGENFRYEIIQIWNPGLMGICEAYNQGAEQAQFENLLFVHEDVLFETQNWGVKLITHLNDESTGVVGLAGSNIKTIFPVAWWDIKVGYANNINQLNAKNEWIYNDLKVDQEAIILDGVFLGVLKNKWEISKFNKLNKSFHGYDVEFCLDIYIKYQNKIISDIKLKHFSQGNSNIDWFNKICDIYINKKWSYSKINSSLLETDIFFRYLEKFNFSRKEKIKLFFNFYFPFNYSIINNLKIIKKFTNYI